MRRPEVGSYEWCEAHGARLDWREKLALLRDFARLQARETWERSVFGAPKRREMQARVDLSAVKIPDSRMAQLADEHAREVCKPTVYLHCQRTFWWGAMLAQAQNHRPDLELLYVASLLHDIGISPGYIEQASRTCFAVIGAREAAAFVTRHAWTEAQARRTYEAVSLHFNPIVEEARFGLEARYVAEGAQLDVLGLRWQRLPGALLDEIARRLPREGFPHEIITSNAIQHAPDSRPDFLSPFGFAGLVRRNVLDRAAPEG
jgi:HD domain